jgi:hypothetical protein
MTFIRCTSVAGNELVKIQVCGRTVTTVPGLASGIDAAVALIAAALEAEKAS